EPFDRLSCEASAPEGKTEGQPGPWPDHQTQRKMHALLKAGDGADRQVGRPGDRVPSERCANRIVLEYDHRIKQGRAGGSAAPASNVIQPAPSMGLLLRLSDLQIPQPIREPRRRVWSHPARQRVGTQPDHSLDPGELA